VFTWDKENPVKPRLRSKREARVAAARKAARTRKRMKMARAASEADRQAAQTEKAAPSRDGLLI
jgi:hypothetical protein